MRSLFVVAAVSAALGSSLGYAQEADVLEEVVITGSILQAKAEIETRRRSNTIVDSISQDEIGAMPDLTIAEAMRRIVGVTTIYNDDIGQFASIRGVHPNFVPVTINGLGLATTGDLGEGTRMVNLQVIPGVAVRLVEAVKTPTADLDAGAMGGSLNILPVTAFDSLTPKRIFTGTLSYSTYMDVPDDNSWGDSKDSPIGGSANFIWTQKFGVDESWGVALSGIYDSRPRTQSNDAMTNRLYYTATGAATNPEAANWNGFAAPNSFLSHLYTNKFEKYGGSIHLEYRPSEDVRTGLYGFAYISDEQETRNTNRLFQLDQPQNLGESTGSMRARSVDTQWRFNTFERDQMGIQWFGDISVGNQGRLESKLGYSKATFLTERPFVSFVYAANKRLTYDLNNDAQRFVFDDPQSLITPSNFRLGATYRDWRDTKSEMTEARVDYSWNLGQQDLGFGYAVGLNYRTFELRRDITSIDYVTGGLNLTGLAFVQPFNYTGFPYPSLWIDADKFWGEAVNAVAVNQVVSARNSRLNDYGYEEDMSAAYFSVGYNTERVKLLAGFRYDDIDVLASNSQTIRGVLQPDLVSSESGYDNLLPYLTGVVNLTPTIRLKAGASRTLGRPNPEDLATAEAVDPIELTISRGNSLIKPRESTNLDLSVEYFFNEGAGMMTMTGFRKEIEDDILTVSAIEIIDGQEWTVTQPINGEKTTLEGVEFGFVNSSFGNLHPALSRIGMSANLLLVEGQSAYLYNGKRREQDRLLWQSDVSANASVFYDLGGGSELRVAMNYKSDYLESYAANPWQDLYIEPFRTYDVTAKWAVTPQWQIRIEGRNVTSVNRYRTTGPDHRYLRAGLEVGSTWFLGATFQP
jgi:iron complex outermembrane recepter protein